MSEPHIHCPLLFVAQSRSRSTVTSRCVQLHPCTALIGSVDWISYLRNKQDSYICIACCTVMVAGEPQRQLSPKARQSDRRAAITAAASATVRGAGTRYG